MKRSLFLRGSRCGLLIVLTVVALVGCSMPWAPASEPETSTTPTSQSTISLSPTSELLAEESRPTPTSVVVTSPTSTAVPAAGSASDIPVSPAPSADPFDLLSLESLFAFLEDLTAIQPYSGWRTSGSEGEAEALDYVAGNLGALGYLQSLGLEDTWNVPEADDSYAPLFWWDKEDIVIDPSIRFQTDRSLYPYLTWAEAHFWNDPLPMELCSTDYPLTWEAELRA